MGHLSPFDSMLRKNSGVGRPRWKIRRCHLLTSSMLLQNEVALITGSGRGIGRAIALLFAGEGASVFLTARTESELAGTAAEITQAGGKASYFAGDLAN